MIAFKIDKTCLSSRERVANLWHGIGHDRIFFLKIILLYETQSVVYFSYYCTNICLFLYNCTNICLFSYEVSHKKHFFSKHRLLKKFLDSSFQMNERILNLSSFLFSPNHSVCILVCFPNNFSYVSNIKGFIVSIEFFKNSLNCNILKGLNCHLNEPKPQTFLTIKRGKNECTKFERL